MSDAPALTSLGVPHVDDVGDATNTNSTTTAPFADPHADDVHAGPLPWAVALAAGAFTSLTFAVVHPYGVGNALAGIALVAAWMTVARLYGRRLRRAEKAALAAMALLALMSVWRTSTWLLTFDALLFAGLTVLLPRLARGGDRFGLWEWLRSSSGGMKAATTSAWTSVQHDGQGALNALRLPLRGLLFGAPLTLVFVALFASADSDFASALTGLMPDDVGTVWRHGILFVVVSWALAGLAFVASRRGPDASEMSASLKETLARLRLSGVELLAAALSFNVVFAVYIALQVKKVVTFDEALAIPGVTYSAAAREGFFQLLFIVVLVAAAAPTVSWLSRQSTSAERRRLHRVLRLWVGLTVLVAGSALWKLGMYVDAYGLTPLRFYAGTLVVFLGGALAFMPYAVLHGDLPGKRLGFVPTVGVALVVGVLGLHVVNPDARMAEVNLTYRSDIPASAIQYTMELSPESVAAAAAAAPSLPADVASTVCDAVDAQAQMWTVFRATSPALSWSWGRVQGASATCAPTR